jgi:hypothetical protein
MSFLAAAAAAAKPPPPWINWTALGKIVVVGLIAGAGLPALFAIGLVALDRRPAGVSVDADDAKVYGGSPIGLAAAALCFAVVLAGIGWGIYEIVNAS